MMRVPMSSAAAGLFRALLDRAQAPREKMLLAAWDSVDWQSLTFAGERHRYAIRIAAPGATAIAERLCVGLADAEFAVAGHVVADIAVAGEPENCSDGSILIELEALTIAD